jgi:predicted  nucleic acid-binding Zn-ribbon protein
VSIRAKLALLRSFNALYAKYLNTIILLEAKNEDASNLEQKKTSLGNEIHKLRKDLHKSWQGRAVSVQKSLSAINTEVQRAIRDIEKDVNTAGKIVKIIGKVDDIVDEIKKLRGMG